MSVESARAFIERMKNDDAFATRVAEAEPEERRRIVREAGFEFTVEDIEGAASELSDEDLDDVSGGVATSHPRVRYGRLYGCTNGCEGVSLW